MFVLVVIGLDVFMIFFEANYNKNMVFQWMNIAMSNFVHRCVRVCQEVILTNYVVYPNTIPVCKLMSITTIMLCLHLQKQQFRWHQNQGSLSLPQVRFQKTLRSSGQSAITLPAREKSSCKRKSVEFNTSVDNHKEETVSRASRPIIKDTNRLAVSAIGDYCLRMSNTPSMEDEIQADIAFNDSRASDVLGYLHMYQNKNRIQFNTLQFNDREDLQVREQIF